MAITDLPTDDPLDRRPEDATTSGEPAPFPSLRQLRWPIVQALRELGGQAPTVEIAEHVADAFRLTRQQRSETVPTGQARLMNRVQWAGLELKHIGVLHYPEPGIRALTPLGLEVEEEQIGELRAQYAAEERERKRGAVPDTDSGHEGEAASVGISNLVQRFREGSAYPTDAHEAQERLRTEWAEKLALENVASLTREDLAAYVSRSVDYGKGEYVKPSAQVDKWILDLDDTQYNRLLDSIRDLCWGTEDLPTRIDRLVDERGASRRDTGTKGFAQGNLNATLAICHPDRFLPLVGHGGKWGFKPMLRKLGLPEPHGSTYGQQFVDANDRLRELLAPHLGDDPQAIGCFLYWLIGQETDSVGGDESDASGLSTLVERFRAETDYPTEAHEEQKRLRAEWAEKLTRENLESLSREDLTAFTNNAVNNGEYVRRVGGVMRWIRDLGALEFDNLLDSIRYLCWSEDELSVRFDQLYLGDSPRKVKGYAGVNISRTLAICHPSSFLPVHRNVGNWGRAKMLIKLGLPAPLGNTPGQRVVDANNRLREHLEPHFGGDTLEMGAFLRWLLARPDKKRPNGPIDLTELADELLIDVDFLEDIVELLQDKGQVILYGPPGTGKTYLARELAKELAPDDSRRTLVQFHPSTSYEDFFEGYRPAGTGDDGGIRFELTKGPLARMAVRAEASKQRHVMIIDEINRGNLPRVLGELLFLLEYRDEIVQTLYRPEEEPFSLPDNLWFIGTMNTADRSIALVDAALRRRFHFVPFFPDSGPMAGLLDRWLDRRGEPAWIGDLVDSINNELKQALDGSHLLLGPSHFMKAYGSSPAEQRQRLRRIWEYNIEPFIEDQFFGDPEQIARFRFDAVWNRHGPSDGPKSGTGRDPRDSELGLAPAGFGSDRELWTRRASEFPPRDRAGDERHHAEIRQVVGRYVEFALDRGADPGGRNDQLVEEFLSSREPPYADKTKTDYQRHVSEWFDHAGADGGAEPGSAQPDDER